jgi:hypothetical protein
MYAGLILFPAVVGWRWFRHRFSELAMAGGLATLLFFVFYAFWVTDRGVFYLPLQFVWGLFAALAVQRLAGSGKGAVLLQGGALAYALLFMFLPALWDFPRHTLLSWALALVFLGFCGGSYLWSVGLPVCQSAGLPVERIGRVGRIGQIGRSSILLAIYAFAAICISLAAYLPHALEARRADGYTLYYTAVKTGTPRDARLITLAREKYFRLDAQTERECLHGRPGDWSAATARQATEWLRESVQPGGAPVFLDETAYARREELWNLEPRIGAPLSDWTFTPVPMGGKEIFRVERKSDDR